MDDDRLDRMIDELERESGELKALLNSLKAPARVVETEEQMPNLGETTEIPA